MKSISSVLFTLCLVVIWLNPGLAQEKSIVMTPQELQAVRNPIYKSLLSRVQNSRNLDRLKAIGFKESEAEWYAAMGYSDTAIRALKINGLQFHKAVFSDCIVIGTVSYLEYDSSYTPYHTIAYVSVDTFLRNDYNITNRMIPVVMQSGPLGRGISTRLTPEDELGQGDHVLLFLSALGLLVDRQYELPRYSGYYEKMLQDEKIRFVITGSSGGTFWIAGDRVMRFGEQGRLSDLLNGIARVLRILNRLPAATGKH